MKRMSVRRVASVIVTAMAMTLVLAFLALVVVLMCFSASYRVAVIAGVIWLAILFAAYQITQAKR